MERKIIQLVCFPVIVFGCTTAVRQYALCNDGTVWYRDALDKKDSSWKFVDDEIPQTSPPRVPRS